MNAVRDVLWFANIHRRQNLLKQNTIAKRFCSGSACIFVFAVGPCGFSFQFGNLPAHLRNLPLQGSVANRISDEESASSSPNGLGNLQ
jgi:hypothetical protein